MTIGHNTSPHPTVPPPSGEFMRSRKLSGSRLHVASVVSGSRGRTLPRKEDGEDEEPTAPLTGGSSAPRSHDAKWDSGMHVVLPSHATQTTSAAQQHQRHLQQQQPWYARWLGGLLPPPRLGEGEGGGDGGAGGDGGGSPDEKALMASGRREGRRLSFTAPSPTTPLKKVKKDDYLLSPHGTFKRNWDVMMLFVILYFALLTPYRICFSLPAEGTFLLLENTFMGFFLFDMLFSFNTIVYIEGGSVIMDRGKIACHYLRFWFWIDLLGSVPYEHVGELISKLSGGTNAVDVSNLSFLRIFRLLRLLRLFKLLKLESFMEHVEIHFNTDMRPFRLVFLLLKLLYLSHILACGWYFVADLSVEAQVSGGRPTTTWITELDAGKDPADAIANSDAGVKYLYSVYWTLTTLTTVGYGDITPTNQAELVYASVTLLVGGLAFGYMIGNISSMIEQLNRQQSLVRDKMDVIKDYLAWRQMPPDLATRIKSFYSYHYSMRPLYDERAILDDLSPALRGEAIETVLSGTVGQLPLLEKTLEREFQLEVFPLLKPILWGKDEVVHTKGDVCMDLLFLLEGQIAVIAPLSTGEPTLFGQDPYADIISEVETDGEHLVTRWPTRDSPNLHRFMHLKTHGTFGESIFLQNRRPYTCMARRPSRALFISREDLKTLTVQRPGSMRRLRVALLLKFAPRERIRRISQAFLINVMRPGTLLWATLKCQRAWARYQQRIHQEEIRANELDGLDPGDADLAVSIEMEALGEALLPTTSAATLEQAARGSAMRAKQLSEIADRAVAKSSGRPMPSANNAGSPTVVAALGGGGFPPSGDLKYMAHPDGRSRSLSSPVDGELSLLGTLGSPLSSSRVDDGFLNGMFDAKLAAKRGSTFAIVGGMGLARPGSTSPTGSSPQHDYDELGSFGAHRRRVSESPAQEADVMRFAVESYQQARAWQAAASKLDAAVRMRRSAMAASSATMEVLSPPPQGSGHAALPAENLPTASPASFGTPVVSSAAGPGAARAGPGAVRAGPGAPSLRGAWGLPELANPARAEELLAAAAASQPSSRHRARHASPAANGDHIASVKTPCEGEPTSAEGACRSPPAAEEAAPDGPPPQRLARIKPPPPEDHAVAEPADVAKPADGAEPVPASKNVAPATAEPNGAQRAVSPALQRAAALYV